MTAYRRTWKIAKKLNLEIFIKSCEEMDIGHHPVSHRDETGSILSYYESSDRVQMRTDGEMAAFKISTNYQQP